MSTKPLRILCAFHDHAESYEWLPSSNPTFDLKEQGHKVVWVHSYSRLEAKLKQSTDKPYDVMLADYYLPKRRGGTLFYQVSNLQQYARQMGVKCCGIFAPEFKEVAPEFHFYEKHKSLWVVSGEFRTPTQGRDTLSMLDFLIYNHQAAVEIGDRWFTELTSGLDQVDLTGY